MANGPPKCLGEASPGDFGGVAFRVRGLQGLFGRALALSWLGAAALLGGGRRHGAPDSGVGLREYLDCQFRLGQRSGYFGRRSSRWDGMARSPCLYDLEALRVDFATLAALLFQELSPGLLSLLIAIAGLAGQQQVAQSVAAVVVSMVDMAIVWLCWVITVGAAIFEVLTQALLFRWLWHPIDQVLECAAHKVLRKRQSLGFHPVILSRLASPVSLFQLWIRADNQPTHTYLRAV